MTLADWKRAAAKYAEKNVPDAPPIWNDEKLVELAYGAHERGQTPRDFVIEHFPEEPS